MYKNQSEIRKKILDALFEINSERIEEKAAGKKTSKSSKTSRINKVMNSLIDELEADEA
tara:strand:+ start:102 stop:278 length:177 start_codon:yes stop_codon:yes gene_type:complete